MPKSARKPWSEERRAAASAAAKARQAAPVQVLGTEPIERPADPFSAKVEGMVARQSLLPDGRMLIVSAPRDRMIRLYRTEKPQDGGQLGTWRNMKRWLGGTWRQIGRWEGVGIYGGIEIGFTPVCWSEP